MECRGISDDKIQAKRNAVMDLCERMERGKVEEAHKEREVDVTARERERER